METSEEGEEPHSSSLKTFCLRAGRKLKEIAFSRRMKTFFLIFLAGEITALCLSVASVLLAKTFMAGKSVILIGLLAGYLADWFSGPFWTAVIGGNSSLIKNISCVVFSDKIVDFFAGSGKAAIACWLTTLIQSEVAAIILAGIILIPVGTVLPLLVLMPFVKKN